MRGCFPPEQTLLLRSRFVQQTFKIQVLPPFRSANDNRRYPVIYATDGNFAFDTLKGIARGLQTCTFQPVAFFLVGIGYPSESAAAGFALRVRDLTFPGYPELSPLAPEIDGVLVAENGTKNLYGADDFVRFLEEELSPYIDNQFGTIPEKNTYFGHSLGGGFGLWTLLRRQPLFRNYIISSPGLSFHGCSSAGREYCHYDFMFEALQRFTENVASLPDVRLYTSVGSEEEFEPEYAQWRLTSNFYRFMSLLRSAPISGLSLSSEVLPGETHMSSWPVAFSHGVRAVFAIQLDKK